MPRIATLKPRVQTQGSRLVTLPRPSHGSEGKSPYTYRWQQARASFLRQHPLCVYCQRAGRVAVATVVDHKQPHRGDPALFWDIENNWQSLCASCHSSVKAKEESNSV